MTEQLKVLLRDMVSAQDTVTDRNVNTKYAETSEARADLITEMRWAQGRRDAIRDRILAEFVRVTAERDEVLEALSPFAARHDRLIQEGDRPLKVLVPFSWLEEARAAIAKAKEGS